MIDRRTFPIALTGLLLTIFSVSAVLAQCPRPGTERVRAWTVPPSEAPRYAPDVNVDGKADLVYSGPAGVSVSLGNGDGTFGSTISYDISTSASLSFGDLTGDGKPEMVAYESSIPRIGIWFNNGSGVFAIHNFQTHNSEITNIADFNGDGKGDLLSYSFVGSSSSFSVRLGNGAGEFAAPTSYSPATSPYYFRNALVGDFNGDNRTDVIANLVAYPSTDPVVKLGLYLNDGSGGLVNAGTTDVGPAELRLTTDLNADGKLDLVGINPSGSTATVFLNNGSGVFTPTVFATKQYPYSVTSTDFNLDGKKDILIRYDYIMYVQLPGSTVLLGNGSGGFSRVDISKPGLGLVNGPLEADFTGDGRADFLHRGGFNAWTGETVLNLLQPTCAASGETGIVDYDGDGMTEYGIFHPADGTWSWRVRWLSANHTTVWGVAGDVPAPGDYDGDGLTDLAVFRPADGVWYVLRSGDSSFFAVPFGLTGDRPVTGDYDGDGRSDIAVFRPSSGVWYSLHSSDGSFHGAQFGLGTDVPTPRDFDGDRKTDLAVFRAGGIWYVLNSASGLMEAHLWGTDGDRAVAADYDGDARADIAVFRPSNGSWYVRRSSNGGLLGMQWGAAGDVPIAGFNRVYSYATPTIWRPSTGQFYSFMDPNQPAQLGAAGDLPVSSFSSAQ
jgi:hypothetical protein